MLKDIDGIDQWDALSKDEKSQRTTIVYNIDQIDGTAAMSIDDWKLVTGKWIKIIFKAFSGDKIASDHSQ